jgi:sulfofructose kinase
MPCVICTGLVTVDVVYDLETFPVEGRKSRASAARIIAGGGALNAAATVASLGGHAMLAASVGDDEFGHIVRRRLSDLGIDDSLIRVLPGVPTAHSAVLVTSGGERTIVNRRDPNLFGAWSTIIPSGFDAVLADTRWPAAALALFEAARSEGRPAILDVEAPVSHAREALSRATHLAFSEQGLEDFAPGAAAKALAHVPDGTWACVTRGTAPVLCRAPTGNLYEMPTFPTQAVDTLGAGDAWHGAFALGLAEGLGEADAVLRANAAAAVKVTRRTGSAWPRPDEVASLIASQDSA